MMRVMWLLWEQLQQCICAYLHGTSPDVSLVTIEPLLSQ